MATKKEGKVKISVTPPSVPSESSVEELMAAQTKILKDISWSLREIALVLNRTTR
jgi:hypothetical protein